MKDVIEIINDGRLHIETVNSHDGDFRIAAALYDPVSQKRWRVIGTRSMGWEHVSVSSPTKTPDWDTMCLAKDVFFRKDECCVQFHPKEEDYINMHEHTLHIWKKMDEEFEMPPSIMVGLKGVTPEQTDAMCKAFIASLSRDELLQTARNQGIAINRKMRRKAK